MPDEMTAEEAAEILEIQAEKYPCINAQPAFSMGASSLRRVASGELQTVVHCKECQYWKDRKVGLPDGTERNYRPDEQSLVPLDVGINIGCHCTLHGCEDKSGTTFWAQANDFCSRGKRKDENNNAS